MFLILIILFIFLLVDGRGCCNRNEDNRRIGSYSLISKILFIVLIICVVYFFIGRFFYPNMFMMRGLNGFLIGC